MVRRRRAAAGLGQEALADKAGLRRTHGSLLERGRRMPSLEVARKPAAALGTTMASLAGEVEAPAEAGPAAPAAGRPGRVPGGKPARRPSRARQTPR